MEKESDIKRKRSGIFGVMPIFNNNDRSSIMIMNLYLFYNTVCMDARSILSASTSMGPIVDEDFEIRFIRLRKFHSFRYQISCML